MAVHARTPQLTERQRMVVAHVRQGYSNREIGEKLGISEDGVKAHLARLYLRYGVTNRVELITTVDETAGHPSAVVSTPTEISRARVTLTRTAGRTTLETSASAVAAAAKLTAVREALLAVDAALGLISELPPETTDPMISAVKRRLGGAITALDEAQRTVVMSAGGSAAI